MDERKREKAERERQAQAATAGRDHTRDGAGDNDSDVIRRPKGKGAWKGAARGRQTYADEGTTDHGTADTRRDQQRPWRPGNSPGQKGQGKQRGKGSDDAAYARTGSWADHRGRGGRREEAGWEDAGTDPWHRWHAQARGRDWQGSDAGAGRQWGRW